MEKILKEWAQWSQPGSSNKHEKYTGKRRPNIIWTYAAASLVLDCVDITKVSKKYTNTQIAEMLNRKETEAMYKHPQDRDRVFTAGSLGVGKGPRVPSLTSPHVPCTGNVQAFIKKMYPSEQDTQLGINALGLYCVYCTVFTVLTHTAHCRKSEDLAGLAQLDDKIRSV